MNAEQKRKVADQAVKNMGDSLLEFERMLTAATEIRSVAEQVASAGANELGLVLRNLSKEVGECAMEMSKHHTGLQKLLKRSLTE